MTPRGKDFDRPPTKSSSGLVVAIVAVLLAILLFICGGAVFLFFGYSFVLSDSMPVQAIPTHGGSATTDVAGLTIEAETTGIDGGSVLVESGPDGVWNVAISGVEVVVQRRDDGALDLKIDDRDYGPARAGDRLLIDRDRNVFLNDQPLAPVGSPASS